MIDQGNKQQASYMISCLSSMLRFVSRKNDVTVRLIEEVGYTKTYVEIMRMRYDEVDFVFDIDDGILEYSTIKLILQPLIENAIYHGLRAAGKKGRIVTEGRLEGDTIRLSVTDDGIGIEADKLRELYHILDHNADPEKIGLQNIQARIKLMYGEAYGLRVEPAPEGGTRVTIVIPRTG